MFYQKQSEGGRPQSHGSRERQSYIGDVAMKYELLHISSSFAKQKYPML